MVVAVIVGILVGVVSVVPFRFATNRVRKVNPTQSPNLLGWFLVPIVISFVILIVGMIVCNMVAHDVILGFVIAEIVAFVVGVIIFGVVIARRRKDA